MLKFFLKVLVYLFSFFISLYGLSALDFNRFIKKGNVNKGQVLYFLIAFALSYLVANFLMNIIYYFQ